MVVATSAVRRSGRDNRPASSSPATAATTSPMPSDSNVSRRSSGVTPALSLVRRTSANPPFGVLRASTGTDRGADRHRGGDGFRWRAGDAGGAHHRDRRSGW